MRRTTPANSGRAAMLPCGNRSLVWFVLAAFVLSSALGVQHALLAQAPKSKKAKKKAPKSTKKAPKKKSKSTRSKTRKKKKRVPKLPSNFTPSKPIPPVMTIEKQLMTEKEEADFRKMGPERKYRDALKSPNPNDKEKAAIAAGAEWQIKRMSMKKYRNELHKLRQVILRDVMMYARRSPAARKELLQQLTNKSVLLFDNNFYVRLNVVVLLTQLNLVDEKKMTGVKMVAFSPVAKPLLQVVADKTQLDAIKVQAVKGLTRACRFGDPPVISKFRPAIALALVPELARQDTHWWYQMRLAEGMAASGIVFDPKDRRRAFVVESLARSMNDVKRHWIARCEAAKSLGRVPLGGKNINPSLEDLVYWTVALTRRMSQDFNKSPKRFYWRVCYDDVYLAFHSENAAAARRRAGFLQKGGNQNHVQGAYKTVVPLVKHVQKRPGRPFSPEMMQPIDDWLKRNQPPKPLAVGPPVAPKAAGSPTTPPKSVGPSAKSSKAAQATGPSGG